MAADQKKTSGEWLMELGAWLGGAAASIFAAALLLAAVLGSIYLDLSLGPQFMSAYAQQTGILGESKLTEWLPYALSVSTTGFQFMLYRTYRKGVTWKTANRTTKLGLVAGWSIAFLDCLTDVGGLTNQMYGPEQGANIFPSSDYRNGVWWALAIAVFIICGLMEWMLTKLLETGSVKKPMSKLPLGWLVEGAIVVTGYVFSALRGFALMVAAISVLFLDVGLTAYWVEQQVASGGGNLASSAGALGWVIGMVITGVQVGLYRRMKMGYNIKKDYWAWFAFLLTGLDTLTDVAGFTVYMYGPQEGFGLMPDEPTLAWALLAGVIVGLCMLYEPIIENSLSTSFNPSKFKFGKKKQDPVAFDGSGSLQGNLDVSSFHSAGGAGSANGTGFPEPPGAGAGTGVPSIGFDPFKDFNNHP